MWAHESSCRKLGWLRLQRHVFSLFSVQEPFLTAITRLLYSHMFSFSYYSMGATERREFEGPQSKLLDVILLSVCVVVPQSSRRLSTCMLICMHATDVRTTDQLKGLKLHSPYLSRRACLSNVSGSYGRQLGAACWVLCAAADRLRCACA